MTIRLRVVAFFVSVGAQLDAPARQHQLKSETRVSLKVQGAAEAGTLWPLEVRMMTLPKLSSFGYEYSIGSP